MVVQFAQSRCKWATTTSTNNDAKSKGRKTLPAAVFLDPYDKLSCLDREKLSIIDKYSASVARVVTIVRNKYVANLATLVAEAIQHGAVVDASLKESALTHSNSLLLAFAVRVPPTVSDATLVYSHIYGQLVATHNKSDCVIVRLRTLQTETLPLMFGEIAKKVAKNFSGDISSCSFELLMKLLENYSASLSKLILLFEYAEQVPIGVLSTAMQLFGQSFTVEGVRPIFLLGVSSAESWHKLHQTLPLRASKNVSFCFLSAGVDANSSGSCLPESDADASFVENVLQDLLLSEKFPLKLGPMCAREVLTWLRDGRLSIATVEKLFNFVAQNQLYKAMAEDGEQIVKALPYSVNVTDDGVVAPSRQRSADASVRAVLSRLQTYWIDVKAACLVMRQVEDAVLSSSFGGPSRLTVLEMYLMTLDSNIAQTRWCNRLLMGIGTLSESDLDKLLQKIINVLNGLKEQISLSAASEPRPNLFELLDICDKMREQYEMQCNEKADISKATLPSKSGVAAFATPSASKSVVDRRNTMMGLFGTPHTSSVSYFEHQARMRAEIKAGKGAVDDATDSAKQGVSTPGGSQRFGTRQFSNRLRDWLFDAVPSKSKIVNSEQSSLFFFDDILLLANSFNPDMNELLSAGLSSKSIRQHLTLKVPALSDFDVHVLFSVFTSSSSAGSIATTAPLNQWYAAFSEARRLRRKKSEPPIDDKEMQARFVSALDELESRGLLRYNPPRRTITKLFECEEDDEL